MPQEPEWYCTQCLLHSPARIRHSGRTPNVARQQDAKNQENRGRPKSLFNSDKTEKVTNASNINRPKSSLARLPALLPRVDATQQKNEGRVQQKKSKNTGNQGTGTASQPIAVADSDEDNSKGNTASSNNKRKSRQAALLPAKVTKQTNGSRSQQQKSKNQQGRKVEKTAKSTANRPSKKGNKPSTALGEATRQNASGEKAKKQQGKQSKKNASEDNNENDLYTVVVPVTSEVSVPSLY